jgi:hypothetical protein
MPNRGARQNTGKLEWKGNREVPELRKSPERHFVPKTLVESVHFVVAVFAVVHFLLFRTAYPSPGLERSGQLEAPAPSFVRSRRYPYSFLFPDAPSVRYPPTSVHNLNSLPSSVSSLFSTSTRSFSLQLFN